MKKSLQCLTVLIVISLFFPILAQYSPNSPYLQNPTKAIGYVDSCANFWLQTYDYQLQGFFTNIDKFGSVITSWGTNKNMLTQSRNVYGMVRAYMLTADTTYLNLAQKALNFMYSHAWDNTYGGWFQELDINGNPISPFEQKTAFYQHYALLGVAAYYEATRDTLAWNWLQLGYEHLENYFWDVRPYYLGYFDKTSFNAQNPSDKSFNATVDAITTHLLALYLMTEDSVYQNRLQELASEIITHLIASMPQQAIGFVEKYDSDWNWNNSETMTLMGHVLKAGWCLARIHQLFPDTTYLNASEVLISDVWQNGYDHEFGGPYKDYNRVTGQMLLWGNPDTTKAWWQMEQAITGGLQMYDLTAESWYLQMADETIEFFMKYFVDHQYGEVYADRTRYGGFAWNEAKGSASKAGYHSIELGYYTYLYGNLFLTYQPVTLHYLFQQLPIDRQIFLTPLAIKDSDLIITNVLREGQAYSNYHPQERVLTLPAGVAGHFEVTYERVVETIASSSTIIPEVMELYQNYPNPFNSSTVISYKLISSGYVKITVIDLTGREVTVLLDNIQPAGNYQLEFDGGYLASGIYFYRLQTNNFIETKKMILIR